jgi:hypothetical protein
VTSVTETFGRQYSRNGDQTATAVKVFCIMTDSDYNDLTNLLRDAITAGLPAMGDAFGVESYETELYVVKQTPLEIEKEKRFFHIQVDYETTVINFAPDDGWVIGFSSVFEEYVPDNTKFNTGAAGITLPANVKSVLANKPVLNTAGDAFDPTVTDFKTKTKITLSKTLDEITDMGTISDINELMDYVNAVNSDAIVIAGISAAVVQFLIEDIQVTKRYDGTADYYDVVVSIIYDPNYHIKVILNAGFQDINNNKAVDCAGNPLPNAQLLDNAGAFIKLNRATNAIYGAFGLKEYSAFATLGLPTTF